MRFTSSETPWLRSRMASLTLGRKR
jgi:hypothetical protein